MKLTNLLTITSMEAGGAERSAMQTQVRDHDEKFLSKVPCFSDVFYFFLVFLRVFFVFDIFFWYFLEFFCF